MEQLSVSFIIPVFNRPIEVDELLQSFLGLEGDHDYEIVIVEDGSTHTAQNNVYKYKDRLNISYLYKSNSGPGDSRNYGMKNAKGNYFIILDSDVLLPPHYLITVLSYLNQDFVDCFGGPDAAHPSFSSLQKAINFVMTSFITTGGIRGHKKQIDEFQPRSFNMGLSREVFKQSKGFGNIHPGEDPDLSLRLKKLEFKTALIPEAFVYHKRRISWSKFYTQVHKFGMVRPILNQWHPESSKIMFWLPSLFIIGFIASLILLTMNIVWPMYIYALYFIVVFISALMSTRSILVSIQSIIAIGIQLLGYGLGFLKSFIAIRIFGKDPKTHFPQLFFNG
ncbi:MAG: glycosyltransferase [Winogradskyella sp.]|nr:glycosyltransferase [Winogradskyella sp.]